MTYEQWLRMSHSRIENAGNAKERMEGITTMYAVMRLMAGEKGYDLDKQMSERNFSFSEYYRQRGAELGNKEANTDRVREEIELAKGSVFIDTISRIRGAVSLAEGLSDKRGADAMKAFSEHYADAYEMEKTMSENVFETPVSDDEITNRREQLGVLLQSLRDDGRGRNWFGRERSGNSPRYNAAIKALENVVNKLDRATPEGKNINYGELPTWEDNRALFTAVKSYMSDKLTVRSTESGQLRVTNLLTAVNVVAANSPELKAFHGEINAARHAAPGSPNYVSADTMPLAKGTIGALMQEGRRKLLAQQPLDLSKPSNEQTFRRLFALETLAKSEVTGIYAKIDKTKAAEEMNKIRPGYQMGVAVDETLDKLKKDPNARKFFINQLSIQSNLTDCMNQTMLNNVSKLTANRIKENRIDDLGTEATSHEQNMDALARSLNRLGNVNPAELDARRDWEAKKKAKSSFVEMRNLASESSFLNVNLQDNPFTDGSREALAYNEIYERWEARPIRSADDSYLDDSMDEDDLGPQEQEDDFEKWLEDYDKKPKALMSPEENRSLQQAGPVLGAM